LKNPFVASAISNAVKSVIEEKGVELNDIAAGTLENLVVEELRKTGKQDIANLLEATAFLNCITNK
jgi:hypothetical protein